MICAICTSPRGPFSREPLGRNDAMVDVCRSCRTETPIARESDVTYRGGSGPSAVSSADMTVAMDRVMGADENARTAGSAIRYGMTPAHALTQAELDLKAVDAESYRRDRTGAANHQDLGTRRRERAYRRRTAR